MDQSLCDWFIAQTRRLGDRQALELLCVALGLDTRALPYIQAYMDTERRWVQGWEAALDAEEERLEQMRLAFAERGVDHLVWSCPGCPSRIRHRCHMWDVPAMEGEGGES